MNYFVDTSAFLAVLGKDDTHHARARTAWRSLLRTPLCSTGPWPIMDRNRKTSGK